MDRSKNYIEIYIVPLVIPYMFLLMGDIDEHSHIVELLRLTVQGLLLTFLFPVRDSGWGTDGIADGNNQEPIHPASDLLVHS